MNSGEINARNGDSTPTDPDAVALLRGLLSHYSPTGQEECAVGFLVGEMKKRGMNARIDEVGNAIGETGSPDAPLKIWLVGHIDTVTGDLPVKRNEETIAGRGAVDAKGPLCTFVCAASRFLGSKDVFITVVGAVAEEGDSRGALHVARAPAPDVCIIGEPSGWDGVVIGYRGAIRLNASCRAEKFHGSLGRPTQSEKLAELWIAIKDLSRPHIKETVFSSLDARLTAISSADDGLTESCEAAFSFRTPRGFDSDAFFAEVEKLATRDDGDIRMNWTQNVPAFVTDNRSRLVRTFVGAIREEGARPQLRRRSGTSDLNILGPAWKCPIVAYGPGDSRLDHTPHEALSLEEYGKATRVLANVITGLSLER